ncbi:hypothetical protein CSC33_3319 [Pseudomonas aeruginosa]|nr:hypothetical protein CSC33_3319 [Pseudomonas aeruginosa]
MPFLYLSRKTSQVVAQGHIEVAFGINRKIIAMKPSARCIPYRENSEDD